MGNHFITNGSFSDTLNFLKSDLLDTYNHQSELLAKLIDTENDESTPNYTGKFCLNDAQFWASYDKNTRKLNIYDAKSTQSSEPNHVIDLDNEENSVGNWSSIDALEAEIQDAMDSTYLMYNAACCAETEEGNGIINRMSANCQSWITDAGTNAKSCFQSMCDAANNAGDNAPAIVTWILSQYQSIAGASGNADGTFTFTDDNYHVQGFAGQYALQVAFQAASVIIGLVTSIIAPVIGLTITLAGQAISSLVGLVPNANDTYVVENGSALNNIYAQPLLQGEWNINDVPVELTYDARHSLSNSVTKRYPGFVIHEAALNGKFYVEIFAALDWANYSSPSRYEANNSTYTPGNKYTSNYPYEYKMLQLRQNHNYTMNLPEYDDLLADYVYMGQISRDASCANFAEWVNYYSAAENGNIASPESIRKYFDRACRSSIILTYYFFFFFAANFHYDNDTSIQYNQSGPQTYPPWQQWTLLDGCHWCVGAFASTWEGLVNTYIPQIREHWKNSNDILDFLENMIVFETNYEDYYLKTDGIPSSRIPRFTPPKYSETARSTTIALAILVGVAVVGTLVAKTTLRITQRKKQVQRYADVQQKWNDYMADKSDENLKAYRKSIKKYNRWCWIAGTSKLSSISGWELGDSSAGSINMPSAYKDASINYNQNNRNTNDELSAILNQIKNVITGS